MGRYSGPEWLQSAKEAIRATVGVAAIEHDSGDDYQVYTSDDVEKSVVMTAVENLSSSEYVIRVSPTQEEDWFFVSIREQDDK